MLRAVEVPEAFKVPLAVISNLVPALTVPGLADNLAATVPEKEPATATVDFPLVVSPSTMMPKGVLVIPVTKTALFAVVPSTLTAYPSLPV
jgi:hypothetical protein